MEQKAKKKSKKWGRGQNAQKMSKKGEKKIKKNRKKGKKKIEKSKKEISFEKMSKKC